MFGAMRNPVIAIAIVLAGCAGDATEPLSRSELSRAPVAIVVAGVELTLDTYIYRDFAPISPPDGQPMIAAIVIKAASGKAIPANLRAESLYVMFGDRLWTAEPVQEWPSKNASEMQLVARNGPKWGPGVNVNVVVRLKRADEVLLLKAPDQPIRRTD